MTFQGDVAGIGLGELLQGLARGGRDGVLTLYGSKLTSAMGLKGGQLYLLPSPDERVDTWRERALRAWADAPSPGLETRRRETIARAHRLETVYQMLEAPNLTFRFDPGPLPRMTRDSTGGLALGDSQDQPDAAYGRGVTVEYLLLEHARIADESSEGPARALESFDVPRALDPARHEAEVRDFLAHCDGRSTLQEIADRVGWPLMRCRITVADYLVEGHVRLAQPRELLASVQRELEQGRPGRAATRLAGWIRRAPAGPPTVGDADLLVGEWDKQRLPHLLPHLLPKEARALLRKLDLVHADVVHSRMRWRALVEHHRADDLAVMHEAILRLVTTDDPEATTFHDLLRLARTFQEKGCESRSRMILRLTASHLPTKLQTRIELGKRMMQNGLIEEGQRWLLDTARELIEEGEGERAMVAVRAVLKAIPDHGEATGLLLQTRSLLVKRKRRRLNVMIGLCAGLIVALAALVEFRSYRAMERALTEIQSHASRPAYALQMLEETFGEDDSPPVRELRTRLQHLNKEVMRELHDQWHERYVQVDEECRFGDPIIGLRRAMELAPPPSFAGPPEDWTDRQDLLQALAMRLEQRAAELELPVDASHEDLNREERLAILIEDLLAQIQTDGVPNVVTAFRYRLDQLHTRIRERSEKRAIQRQVLDHKAKESEQNILLATARAHDQAGDLDRSLLAYGSLVESDPELGMLLQEEIARVKAHWEAVKRALVLAGEGRHGDAAKALDGVCPRPVEHLLPWNVDSLPAGARVTMPDGRVRQTPFLTQSGVGERVELRFELAGHETREIVLTQPQDLSLHLHRLPERTWANHHRVDAVPVPVGDDHVVTDRAGRVARLDRNGATKWEHELATLGGIARTPVFLPGKPGHLLVLSEDGRAWLIQAQSGEVSGPREIGSVTVEGPTITRGGVSARFADGRVALWGAGLEPTFYSADNLVRSQAAEPVEGAAASATQVVLRRNLTRDSALRSPWTGWTVAVKDEEYQVRAPDGRGFTVARAGEWVFLCWESPKSLVPYGRLWISDGKGLRSFLPDGEVHPLGK